jgi:iron complex outermembrane receptor protein
MFPIAPKAHCSMTPTTRAAVHAALLLTGTGIAHAADSSSDEDVLAEVVVTAPYGHQIARDRVPGRVQIATTDDIAGLQPLDITELLNRGFGSVNINHAQNNPLQPDVNFRGQTASPLLGLAQGLSVYADGVRMNETFGDTVNWDLLPLSAVQSVQLLAGTNPVFGLNSLGGALSLSMKNGFSAAGTAVEGSGGSFGRGAGSVQHGGNHGNWGWYGDIDYFREDGWRDFSKSNALRGYGALSWRNGEDSFDLSYAHADSKLRGNGPAPVELLEADRRAVFTWPDITDNRLNQVIAAGSKSLAKRLTLSGNLFFRKLRTSSFNGDGTMFEACDINGDGFLVDEDFDDADEDGECSDAGADQYELVLDQNREPIAAEIGGEQQNAINNLSRRNQRSYGGSAQLGHELELGESRSNTLTVGAAWQDGKAAFDSVVEVAALTSERGTTRTGTFADDFRTAVDTRVRTWSLYAADTFDITSSLSLTAAARYDRTRIELADQSGLTPELDGSHSFGRVNPALGLSWHSGNGLVVYGNVSQASRTPTAVELACAEEAAPCNLPNAFLADPPLQEILARSIELGVRGEAAGNLDWQLGVFQTTNRDDILFQTVGGATANVGFFQNVSDTRRRGIEVSLEQDLGAIAWRFDYTLLDATYRDEFIVNSPNHPLFGDDADGIDGAELVVGDGKLLVQAGRRLPGIARHQANLGLDLKFSTALSAGVDLEYRAGVYLRGDEINVLDRTGAYAVLNLHGRYSFTAALDLFARIENLFDSDFETFGLLGEPDEVFADFEDPRFQGAGPPRGIWLGLRLRR